MTTTMMSRRKKMHKGVEISQEVGTSVEVVVKGQELDNSPPPARI